MCEFPFLKSDLHADGGKSDHHEQGEGNEGGNGGDRGIGVGHWIDLSGGGLELADGEQGGDHEEGAGGEGGGGVELGSHG